jgi:hypothetical protein
MKPARSANLLFGTAVTLCLVLCGCGKHEAEGSKAAEQGPGPTAEKTGEPESRVSHGTNAEAIITLDAETQKRIGLQIAELKPAQYAPEVAGYARIQDSSWIGTTITELQAAQIALDAARQEFERLKTLREQNNASEKALQTAQTAVAREQNNSRSILIKVQAAWGRKLADLIATYASATRGTNSPANADPLPMQLFGLERLLVRADFPPSAAALRPEGDVKFFTLAANAAPVAGTFFDYAPMADPLTQTRGIFYLIDNASRQFAPGMSLKVAAPTSEAARSGVLVPRDAILRAEGADWVYRRIAPDKFTRREIKPDQMSGPGWFVIEGLKPGDTVVTGAAQELLSEELKEQ